MKKIEYEHIQIPKQVVQEALSVKEIPGRWYGMENEYKYIVWPELTNEWLLLRAYEVQKIKDGFEYLEDDAILKDEEDWMMFIYPNEDKWVTVRKEEKTIWGKASIDTIMGCQGYYFHSNNIKILHSSVVKKDIRFNKDDPMQAIFDWQEQIRLKNLNEKQNKKDEKTKAIMKQEKTLPRDYLKWQEEVVMKESRYIIYKATATKKREAFCTHCKTHLIIDRSDCHHNKKWKCPSCRSKAIMKASGRVKKLVDESWTEYVQAIEDGLMIRYINMIKGYSEYGFPRVEVCEPARVIIQRGKEAVWYEKRDCFTKLGSSCNWQKNNVEGAIHSYNNPVVNSEDMIYKKGLLKELDKAFPYNTYREYKKRHQREPWSIYDYFDRLSKYPMIESLEKTGKTLLVDELVSKRPANYSNINLNPRAKRVHELIYITRQQYKEMGNEDFDFVRFIHYINDVGIKVSMSQIKELYRYSSFRFKDSFKRIVKVTTVHKFLKYAKNWIPAIIKDYYFDYFEMATRLEYDMTNTFNLFPKHLKEAHDHLQEEQHTRENEIKLRDAKKEDAKIQKVERKIRKAFTYETDQYIIRPAKSNQEIVAEGQIQHICVGGGSYKDKMVAEKSYILFLRRKEDPDKPFYTIEITPEYHIVQWHGKYNREDIEHDEVSAFLQEFVDFKGKKKRQKAS